MCGAGSRKILNSSRFFKNVAASPCLLLQFCLYDILAPFLYHGRKGGLAVQISRYNIQSMVGSDGNVSDRENIKVYYY